MRFTVPTDIVVKIGALLLIILPVQPVLAACTNTSQCATHQVCQDSLVPGIKECKELRCNDDSQCPTARPLCLSGACRSTTGGGPTGKGIPQSGVGGKCGQVKIGQVTKNMACQKGLQCVKVPVTSDSGTCQEPAQ